MTDTDRRAFLKGAATTTVGAGATTVTGTAHAQPPTVQLNPNARAVLPNGQQVDRAQILQQLGLDPNTRPDAWLAVVACGSNASALRPDQLRGLIDRGTIDRQRLDTHSLQRLRAPNQ